MGKACRNIIPNRHGIFVSAGRDSPGRSPGKDHGGVIKVNEIQPLAFQSYFWKTALSRIHFHVSVIMKILISKNTFRVKQNMHLAVSPGWYHDGVKDVMAIQIRHHLTTGISNGPKSCMYSADEISPWRTIHKSGYSVRNYRFSPASPLCEHTPPQSREKV